MSREKQRRPKFGKFKDLVFCAVCLCPAGSRLSVLILCVEAILRFWLTKDIGHKWVGRGVVWSGIRAVTRTVLER